MQRRFFAPRPVATAPFGLAVVLRTGAVLLLAAAAGFGLAACEDKKPPLKGERIPVLVHENQVLPDVALVDVPVVLPRPIVNSEWSQAGGNPRHVMEHLSVGEELRRAWRTSIGSGTDSDKAILPQAVVAAGRIFTMDTDVEVRAFSTEDGKRIWSKDVLEDDDDVDAAIGGGLAYKDGILYVATGVETVLALNAETGDEVWRQQVSGPVRAPPTVSGDRLYVVTIDNELYAMDAKTGKTAWKHTGISEIAGILGGSAPAVEGNTVVVPYSSGEVYALQAANGRVLWADNLGPVRRGDIASQITDIRGLPVVDGDYVYAISHGGRMVAIDFKTGRRVWDKLFGGVQTPWVAGDYIYVITTDEQLICLNRKTGQVRWVAVLLQFENTQDRENPITWNGPVLAGDRLLVTSSRGEALSISPYTGEMLGKMNLPGSITLPPIVAGDTIYVLSDTGELVALR